MQLWQRFARSRVALAGLVVVVLYVALAALAPVLAPYDPNQNALRLRLAPPSAQHWLGNDELGRDILSRLLWGARTSLFIAVGAVAVSIVVGVPLGLFAGYYRGHVDSIVSGVLEVLMAFPGILLALAIVAIFGFGTLKLTIALGIYSVPTMARLVRGSTLQVSMRDFIEAALAMGQREIWVMFRHVLPNILSPIIIDSSLRLAAVVLTASTLSFLGLGVQPPAPEWGAMIASSRGYMRSAPHATLIPGIALMIVVLAFNLAGDGLRDALDPTLKNID